MRWIVRGTSVLILGAMVASCAGSGAPVSPQVGAALQARGHSWILPQARGKNLIYISDLLAQVVDIYTYQGHQLVGTLTGFFNPEGLCVDAKGDVFVVNDTSDGTHQITEYAHGGTEPIATLVNENGNVNGCSVNTRNGDLAVTNFWGPTEGAGGVSIYQHASGTPTFYSSPDIYYYYFCGYDDYGNLFVDGLSYGSNFGFAELPKGGSALKNVALDETIYLPGGVQWDGKYLAVGDQVAVKHNFTSVIYQFAISGSSGTTVGMTTLEGSNQVSQFWIPKVGLGRHRGEGTVVIGPNQGGKDTLFWNYPAGQEPINSISGETDPVGSTVSMARK